MGWAKPQIPQVFEAIESYLAVVYAGEAPPIAVRQRVDTLRATSPEDFFDSPVFELDNKQSPTRYAIRLGNKSYPHMKMVIERSPDGRGYLFRADTHDRHIRPAPDCREYKAFTELMQANQKVAEEVENEWGRRGLPTFREYLRRDVARRLSQTERPDLPAHPTA